VGKQHQFMLYVQSANLMSRMRATLLSAPSAPTNKAAAETVDEAQAEEKSRPESEAGSQLASANENSRSAAQAEPPE
jgi:hypothetical protein